MLKKLIIFILSIGLGGLAFAQTKSAVPSLKGQSTSEEKKTDTEKKLPIDDASLIKPEIPLTEEAAAGDEKQEESETEKKERPAEETNENYQGKP